MSAIAVRLVDLCARLHGYRFTFAAIEARTEALGDAAPDTPQAVAQRTLAGDFAACLRDLLGTINAMQAGTRPNREEAVLFRDAILLADVYTRADIDDAMRDEIRDFDFSLDGILAQDAPSDRRVATPVTLYARLRKIGAEIATLYDDKKWDRLMIGSLIFAFVIGGISLLVYDMPEFKFDRVQLQGAAGAVCGAVLGILLHHRRVHKIKTMAEALGEEYGCDLKGMDRRSLAIFTHRIARDIGLLGLSGITAMSDGEVVQTAERLQPLRYRISTSG